MASELHVVTGGGTGMGRDIALRLAEQGQTVVIVGRREEPLSQTAAAARGGCIEVVVADVSTVEGARSLVAAIGDRAVTGMVAAAGGQGDSGDDASPEAVRARWVAALDKNLLSTVLPVECLLPRVVDDRGRIVLIASTSALDGRGGPYATAKAAVAGYGRDLALRAGARGITANVVAPGFVSGTGFFEVGGYGTPNGAMLEQAAAGTLVGRVGTPRDVTHIVTNLLSVDAGWITGQLISPNGGMVLH